MHVKSTPYHFAMLLPRFTSIGPKQSMPTWLNGGAEGFTLSSGKLDIFCSPTEACLLLQLKHEEILFEIVFEIVFDSDFEAKRVRRYMPLYAEGPLNRQVFKI